LCCRRAVRGDGGSPHRSTKAKGMNRPRVLEGEDLLPEPVQQRSIAKRERIKAAALALFGERGYERTSLEDIAHRAEVAVGGVYLHFRSKRQLLLVLMDDLLERLSDLDLTPAPAPDVRTALHGLLSHAFSADLHYLGAYRALSEAVHVDPTLQAKDQQIHRWTNSRITALFQRLQQLPGARPDVDARALGRTMDVVFWTQLARAAALRPRELREWISVTTDLIYHALFLDRLPL